MYYPFYDSVTVEKSKSSYGRYVVKCSEVSFRFFFSKERARQFAHDFNTANKEARQTILEHGEE